MTENDWRRLHGRVMPNPVSLATFKDIVSDGTLHDYYLAKDLHKIMQELRDLLHEHGELREASVLPLSGRKQELSRAAAAAVQLLTQRREVLPPLRRTFDNPVDAASGGVRLSDRDDSLSPTLPSNSDPRLSDVGRASAGEEASLYAQQGTSPPLRSRTMRSSRVLPLIDHIGEEGDEEPLVSASPQTVPQPIVHHFPSSKAIATAAAQPVLPSTGSRAAAVARNGSAERSLKSAAAATAAARSWPSWADNPCVTAASASRATTTPVTPAAMATAARTEATPPIPASKVSVEAAPGRSSLPSSTASSYEMMQLNESASPFYRMLGVPRRFHLRFGSSVVKFELPVQFAEGIHNRQLRVYCIPLRHPNMPARWPTAKEIVVYVNRQCVMTPWKRSWPERRVEVAKTYLPLDITYLLSRNVDVQHMQVDIHNRDYQCPAILTVVQHRSLDEVTESILTAQLGCSSIAQAQQALLTPESTEEPASTRSCLLASNREMMWATYKEIMAEDEHDDGLEVDDPVITTKCPISQQPLRIPVRGSRCAHLQCVDLASFLVSCSKGSYWNCALCDAEMRSVDVRVDTVLWRYLCTFASVDAYPLYLRLSAARSPPSTLAEKEKNTSFYWHPSNRNGGDADDVIDDENSDDEDSGQRTERRAAHAEGPADAPSPPCPFSSDSGQGNGDGGTSQVPSSKAPPLPSGENIRWAAGELRKRSRTEEEAECRAARGTADDPIEL